MTTLVLNIPDVNDPEFNLRVKEVLEYLLGKKTPSQKAATYQDLINMNIIDKDFNKV